MASASGSNPAAGDETKMGTEKRSKTQDKCKASADSEIEENRKLEEELRESKGEVQRKSERIKSLEAALEARNAEVKTLMRRERESRIREATIKDKIDQGRQLDVAFLVHMDANIHGQTTKEYIKLIGNIVDKMASENKKQEWKLRIAFAPYRDYKYHKSVKFDAEPCDFTHRFPNNLLRRALSRFEANNSDRKQKPELFGGNSSFEEYLATFDWKATNKVIIHIKDDYYRPQCSMRKEDVETAIGGSLEIVDKNFQELRSMSKAVMLEPLTKPLLPPISKYLPEEIDKRRLGKSGQIQCRSYFKHEWFLALEDLITTIKENKDFPYIKREKVQVQVQIAEKPFEDDHPTMWPYFAKVTLPGEAPKKAVAYRFKTPMENDHSLRIMIEDWQNRDHYLARMEVHSVANQMAAKFNEMIEPHGTILEFPEVTTLSVGSRENAKFYNVVEDPKGSPNTKDILQHDDILQAFTHWTHHISSALLMIQIKPQGVEIWEKPYTQDVCLRISDPVIHCSDVMRFLTHKHIDTHTNLGSEGFKFFSASHVCNNVCKELGLAPLP